MVNSPNPKQTEAKEQILKQSQFQFTTNKLSNYITLILQESHEHLYTNLFIRSSLCYMIHPQKNIEK